MTENEYTYVYAEIILMGEGLNPLEVTNSLGLHPLICHKIGDNKNEFEKWEINHWCFSSKDKIQSHDLTLHLQWLINQIEPVKTKFLTILNKNDIKAEISCFWILPSDHEVLSLDANLIKNIADLGIKLEIDVHSP